MNGKAHLVAGGVVVAGLVYLGDYNVLTLGGVMLGSILPDIDSKESTINRLCPPASAAYKMIHKFCFNKSGLLYNFTKHRGYLMHSWLTIALILSLSMITPWLIKEMLYGLAIGVLSHHALDCLTPQGLRYFYPNKLEIKRK
jgi:membrane-bound metal-dependent hydrolase YbcI (DUF457 family)